MKRVAAVSAVLAVLILGVLVGVLGTHLFYAQKFRQPGSFSAVAGRFFAERLDRELALTEEQRQRIATILAQTRREAGALREELRPRIGALMDGAAERISEVLTPEQRERFRQLRARHRGRSEHFFLGPPGRHGPPGARGRWHRPWHERGAPPLAESEEAPVEDPPGDPDS